MECIGVITICSMSQTFTGQEKVLFITMTMQSGSSVSSIARQYGITPSLLFMQDGGVIAVEANDQVGSVSDYNTQHNK